MGTTICVVLSDVVDAVHQVPVTPSEHVVVVKASSVKLSFLVILVILMSLVILVNVKKVRMSRLMTDAQNLRLKLGFAIMLRMQGFLQ